VLQIASLVAPESGLRNWNPRRPVSELLARFLDDFLKQNGYHAIGDAVADTIEATAGPESTSRTAIAKPRAGASSKVEHGDR
jgi:hypothetical protein